MHGAGQQGDARDRLGRGNRRPRSKTRSDHGPLVGRGDSGSWPRPWTAELLMGSLKTLNLCIRHFGASRRLQVGTLFQVALG